MSCVIITQPIETQIYCTRSALLDGVINDSVHSGVVSHDEGRWLEFANGVDWAVQGHMRLSWLGGILGRITEKEMASSAASCSRGA
eukprot:1605337-Ditylum_brightwellii.AAC.1